ncbi:mechanosensitive ion channel family protein [Aequorivita lipolytica]|uniref:Mechanosensitive ion channel family protein n=1 Tax=Aequorivita lipolytica TaxID=153267 RepID=A0A5C6YSZ7_9FLAO|nr:mechanosensitive ion channel family protein [Aequorivita lipolytica]TXD70115.1 mechanosensitive ion channel family protein [Aequorivita lipolytica]SRX50527.1 Small-conductance mechanosensitive channel [Aequorivita lipolytica]
MIEFLETYKTELFYSLGVILAVVLLRIATNLFHRWLVLRGQKRVPGIQPTAITLVKRILNSLWLVMGLMALIFLFFEDAYQKFKHDFQVVLYLGVVSVITIVIASSVHFWFKKSIKRKINDKEDPTAFKFLRYIAVFAVYLIGVLIALLAFPSLKGVAQTALGGAGVIALIAGVASQEALANLVGGVFIISFKPFKIGDIIKVTDTMVGTVVDITLRHTVLRNFDNKMIVIPNAIINKEKLINYNLFDLKICERIEFEISYESNLDLAKKIMKEECEAHPLIIDNRSDIDILDGSQMVRTALVSINESTLTVRAWCWARNYEDSFNMRCDLLESVKNRFDKEGIDLAYPHRTIVFKDNKVETETGKSNSEEEDKSK